MVIGADLGEWGGGERLDASKAIDHSPLILYTACWMREEEAEGGGTGRPNILMLSRSLSPPLGRTHGILWAEGGPIWNIGGGERRRRHLSRNCPN